MKIRITLVINQIKIKIMMTVVKIKSRIILILRFKWTLFNNNIMNNFSNQICKYRIIVNN